MLRPLLVALAVALLATACSAGGAAKTSDASSTTTATTAAAAKAPSSTAGATTTTVGDTPGPNLAPGSHPDVLPANVLIADHLNSRLLIVTPTGQVVWKFPRPGDLAPGQTFKVPDDAFFTPDGKYILATQEDDFVISLIDVATHHIVWQYGTPGVHGSGPNHLWNPDDAIMMPDGNIILADIKNCRILVLRPPLHHPLHVYGMTTNACLHNPPQRWGSPNGAFPLTNGNELITEINGDWVDGLSLSGQVTFSVHPPGVNYPSDTNEVRPGVFLTVDYSSPGQILEFTKSGQVLWRYKPAGAKALNHPSLALPLPNGDVLLNDDANHRVIVVDPKTNKVVWQYGHYGVHGVVPGYLYRPDGVDLAPPYSLAITHAATMGEYPVPPGAAPVPGSDPALAKAGGGGGGAGTTTTTTHP
ncbi:MAG: hypothetical protein ACRD0J_08285 [Acidimicrobiales bacterium]